jgi:hypothetical protein
MCISEQFVRIKGNVTVNTGNQKCCINNKWNACNQMVALVEKHDLNMNSVRKKQLNKRMESEYFNSTEVAMIAPTFSIRTAFYPCTILLLSHSR